MLTPDINFEEVIGYADEAMYTAKANNRNQVCIK
jgi:PleD family two-component response regulator